jgi:hypothetical protein
LLLETHTIWAPLSNYKHSQFIINDNEIET